MSGSPPAYLHYGETLLVFVENVNVNINIGTNFCSAESHANRKCCDSTELSWVMACVYNMVCVSLEIQVQDIQV